MILSSGAYRDIAGTQHAIHGANTREYSAIKQKKRVLYIRFPELLEKFHIGRKTGKEMSKS